FAVADDALSLPSSDATAWFALDPAQRTPWLQRGDLRASAALLLLEQAALRREEAAAREELKQRFLRGDGAGIASGVLRELLDDGAYGGRPATLLDGEGYGLPQGRERARLAQEVATADARLRGLRDGLQAEAHRLLPVGHLHRIETA